MTKKTEVLLKVEAALEEREKRIADLERQLGDAQAFQDGQPPVRNMVSFVGGPLHGTDQVLPDDVLLRRRYTVPIVRPHTVFDGPLDMHVRTGEYMLTSVPVAFSHIPYWVGVWQGAR